MVEVLDVVLWVGAAGGGLDGVVDVDEGPIVDEFERCVHAGMPEMALIQRMSWVLDMAEDALSIHPVGQVVALGVGLDAI